jgi:RluA family pseudouridine synthase
MPHKEATRTAARWLFFNNLLPWLPPPSILAPMLTIAITENDHCRRAESFMQNLLPAAPLSYIRKLFKSGHITIDGQPALPDAVLQLDAVVALKESGRLTQLLSGRKPELDILFEDEWILLFNKEPGLAVHRAAEVDERNLVELGQAFLRRRDRIPENSPLKLRPVNRLDRGTSGAIILAKSPTSAGMFGRMVKEEGLGKLYLALVEGKIPPEGVITAPLEGKESETAYHSLLQGHAAAFVAVMPVTGRMHQIRQHFRSIGHPVLGDKRYGGRSLRGFAGHALHSFRTSFTHPATGVEHRVHAPLPPAFLRLLRELAGSDFQRLIKSLLDPGQRLE